MDREHAKRFEEIIVWQKAHRRRGNQQPTVLCALRVLRGDGLQQLPRISDLCGYVGWGDGSIRRLSPAS